MVSLRHKDNLNLMWNLDSHSWPGVSSMASSVNKAVADIAMGSSAIPLPQSVLKSKLLAKDIATSQNRGSRFGRNPPFLRRFSIVSLSGRLQDLE